MVTDNDQVAENSATNVNDSATIEETTLERLQREKEALEQKYKSSEGRRRKLEAQLGHNAESEERMATFVTESIKTVLNEDDPQKRAEKLQEIGARREAARQLAERITSTQVELDKLIAESNLDWENDPDLADARDAWNSSKPEDAYRLASLVSRERALKEDHVSNEEIDEIVETKLRNARQDDSSVDTGSSTAASPMPTNDPKNAQELRDYLELARVNKVRISRDERLRLVRGATGR